MIADLRRSPATSTLAILWVAVFVMMHLRQGSFSGGFNPFAIGAVEVATSHQFGDATSAELASGQVWRAVTSTFVHYGLLHLMLNLFGLVELGLLVEGWYGSAMLLAIYLAIGGLGNLLAGFTRPWFGIPPNMHSGGGSTVVFGLVGLCAVVGRRLRTEEGRDLSVQMVAFLVLNLAIGLLIPALNRGLGLSLPNFDNLAHLGGTLVGAILGLAHRPMEATATRPAGRWIGLAAALVLVGCMAEQSRANRAELEARERWEIAREDWQAAGFAVAHLVQLDLLYRMAFLRGRHPEPELQPPPIVLEGVRGRQLIPLPPRAQIVGQLKATLEALEADKAILDVEPTAPAFRRLRDLASQALQKPPTSLKLQEFETRLATVLGHAEKQAGSARSAFEDLSHSSRRR